MKATPLLTGLFLIAACAGTRPSNVVPAAEEAATDSLKLAPRLTAAPVKPDSVALAETGRLKLDLSSLPRPPLPVAAETAPAEVSTAKGKELQRLDSLASSLQHELAQDSIKLTAKVVSLTNTKPAQVKNPLLKLPEFPSNICAPSLQETAKFLKHRESLPAKPTPQFWERNTKLIFTGSVIGLMLIFFTFLATKKHYEGISEDLQRTGN